MSIPSLLAKSIMQATLSFFCDPLYLKGWTTHSLETGLHSYKAEMVVLDTDNSKQGLDEDTVQQQSHTLLSTNVESTWEYMSSWLTTVWHLKEHNCI